jgi:hypothetical protein
VVFAALALSHSFFCRASICEALLHHLHVEIVREQRWRARRTDRRFFAAVCDRCEPGELSANTTDEEQPGPDDPRNL